MAALAVVLTTASPAAAQTLPEWGRPLAPAEARELRATVARAAQQNQIAYATLEAITRAVGVRKASLSFSELIAQVEGKAREAATLAAQIAALKRRVSVLASAERGPAEAALARAQAAFAAGRLDDADRELASLETLRRGETADTRRAWLDAVSSRAEIARLQLDYAKAASLQRAAQAELAAMAQQLATEQWRMLLGAARDETDQGKVFADRAAADRAIASLRDEALPLVDKAVRPEDWGRTQYALGIALTVRGEREEEEGAAILEQAAAAFDAAASVCGPDRFPELWAQVQTGMASAQIALGARQTGVVALRRAAEAGAAAVAALSPTTQPDLWADAQTNRAIALNRIFERGGDLAALREAIDALRLALARRSQTRSPFAWARIENNLGAALAALGDAETGTARYREAIAAYEAALSVYRRESLPQQWAMVQNNLGVANWSLANREADRAARERSLEASVAAFGLALEAYRFEVVPLDWAMTEGNRGSAMQALGESRHDAALLEQAAAAIGSVLKVYKRETAPMDWAMTQLNHGSALSALGAERHDPATLAAAAASLRAALEVYKRDDGPIYWAMTETKLAQTLMLTAKLVPDCAAVREADEALAAALPLYARPDLARDRAEITAVRAEAAAMRAKCR